MTSRVRIRSGECAAIWRKVRGEMGGKYREIVGNKNKANQVYSRRTNDKNSF